MFTKQLTVILILRLYAMYSRNRAILYALSLLLIVQIVAETVIAGPLIARLKRECFLIKISTLSLVVLAEH